MGSQRLGQDEIDDGTAVALLCFFLLVPPSLVSGGMRTLVIRCFFFCHSGDVSLCATVLDRHASVEGEKSAITG